MEPTQLATRLATLHSERRATATASPDRRSNRECLEAVRSTADPSLRESAAKDLIRRCRALCAATIARQRAGLNADAIDDLAQDVLVKLLASPEGTDPSPAYIETIAAHVLIDRHRHTARRGLDGPTVSFDDPDNGLMDLMPDATPTPEATVVERVGKERLVSAIREILRPREAEIVLRRADGDPHENIAADLGLAVPHVRKIAERAFRRLRENAPALAG